MVISNVVRFPATYVYQCRTSYELFSGRREKGSLYGKEPHMTQDQATPACQSMFPALSRQYLLAHNPILMPVVLLSSALGLCAASFFTSSLFPLLALLGIAAAPLCLALAFVLGITGILASIIGILEHIDRDHLRSAILPEEKGAW